MMLYNRRDLKDIIFPDSQIPFVRYLHKYEQGKLKKLKMHEKEFLFEHILLRNNDEEFNRKAAFDLRKIEEAKEFLFYMIILTYSAKGIIDFESIAIRYNGKKISADENRKNKRFFYEYMSVWKNQVNSKKGEYLSQIANTLNHKLKDWEKHLHTNQITKKTYQQKTTYIWALFFHIYYHTKLYFDEKKYKYEEILINGYKVRFDIYSFIHIMSRHYYPDMNADIGISLNSSILEINLDELPTSILALIKSYFQHTVLTEETEFLLLTTNKEKYILWIKYCTLNGTNRETGFQVRSFYKCEAQRDLDKFIDKTEIRHTDNLSFLYNKFQKSRETNTL